VWWHILVTPAPRRLRQEDYKLEACPGYIVRPCLKTRKNYPHFIDEKVEHYKLSGMNAKVTQIKIIVNSI
jgi:hypothetical protein